MKEHSPFKWILRVLPVINTDKTNPLRKTHPAWIGFQLEKSVLLKCVKNPLFFLSPLPSNPVLTETGPPKKGRQIKVRKKRQLVGKVRKNFLYIDSLAYIDRYNSCLLYRQFETHHNDKYCFLPNSETVTVLVKSRIVFNLRKFGKSFVGFNDIVLLVTRRANSWKTTVCSNGSFRYFRLFWEKRN